MIFRQYELGCLSLFSYLIGDESTGRAVVVDPQRDVTQYLEDAAADGLHIERVIETHLHADFVSGHLELAAKTGATISYGEGAEVDFAIEPLQDGTELVLGQVVLSVLATPGHTPESISVVIREQADAPPFGVLTGDTLFIGDVGRPDLLAAGGLSPDELARRLYRSLHDKLLPLPDATLVLPAHGAGSACGKNMSSARESTIGEQRTTNYALQPMTEDEFVTAVTEGQPVSPLYFPFASDANRHEHKLLDDTSPPPALGLDDLERWRAEGAVVIDGRSPEVFASGHLRGSINVALDGRFAEYAGDVVRPGQPIVVITDPGRETEATVRLARIGFDSVVGAVAAIDTLLTDHPQLAESSTRLAAADVATWLATVRDVQVIDVRNPSEHEQGNIAGSTLIPLARLLDRADELDPSRPTVVYCAGGARSSIAASLLRTKGFPIVADILGGFGAWQAAASSSTPASSS